MLYFFCAIFVQKSLLAAPFLRYSLLMSKIIRRTITITLTESWTFVWDGMDGALAGTDDVTSNCSSNQQQITDTGGETIPQETENGEPQMGSPQRAARTLSQTRSRRRRKSSSPLPKTDS